MIKKYSQSGFTLIELLVVIAIIGILSSVVLASLSTARNKGKDAAIRSELNSLRSQVELAYDTLGATYGPAQAVCTPNAGTVWADTQVIALIAKIDQDNGASANTACINTTSAWAAQVQLLGDPTKYVCVDSTGAVKDYVGAANIAAGTKCP